MNSVQLFGALLLGGLAAGEISRRVGGLPRTTGYVVFGLLAGQEGFGAITPADVDSVRLFIDLALGLILFELGHRVASGNSILAQDYLRAGLAESVLSGLLMVGVVYAMGFSLVAALFAAAVGISTSPAITVATCADIGAQGPRTDTLMSLVAINGIIAFVLLALLDAAAFEGPWWQKSERFVLPLLFSLVAGIGGARLLVLCAGRLGRHGEHQHLLVLGFILLAVGTCQWLGVSVLLPLLCLGIGVRLLDREHAVVSIRISSDARIFLVAAFVLAGTVLRPSLLWKHWQAVLLFVAVRAAGKFVVLMATRRHIGLGEAEARALSVGLMPMSGVTLVLISESGLGGGRIAAEVQDMILAAILLMQLLGPLATQYAIRTLGEATRLPRRESLPTDSTPSAR